MSLHRLKASRDLNEITIFQFFQKAGRHVTRVSAPGFPDLCVIRPDRDIPVYVVETIEQAQDVLTMDDQIALVEVKSKGGRLTPAQKKWHNEVTLG